VIFCPVQSKQLRERLTLGEIMFKRHFFGQLFLAVAIFSFFAIVNAATSSQTVYLVDEPLPKIIEKLEKKGMSLQEIRNHLRNTLPKITPELARQKFNIKWLDSTLPYNYPEIAICYMDSKVGYGLFAMDDIKEGGEIAEYIGKHIVDEKAFKKNDYIVNAGGVDGLSFEKIDAKNEGNAARFAQHLLSGDTLKFYGYTSNSMPRNAIATANAGLRLEGTIADRHMVLIATKDIFMFEQIGYEYASDYGYEGTMWPEEPYLFDVKGETIPKSEYQILFKGILLLDQFTKQYALLKGMSEGELRSLPKSERVVDNHMVVDISEGSLAIVDLKVWEEQISRLRNRLVIPSYFVHSYTKIDKFIEILKELDEYGFGEEDRVKILNAAKDNNYKKANQLLNSLKKELREEEMEL